jgi:hypothetical protein
MTFPSANPQGGKAIEAPIILVRVQNSHSRRSKSLLR